MSQPTKVAVVVVTYDSLRFIDDCFGALAKARTPNLELRVIAVDNGSKDGSAAAVRERFPWVEVLEQGKNLGFAGGNNVGMRLALEWGAEWIYLLNHDADVQPDFLTEALAQGRANPKVGAVQSLLLLADEPELINSAGNAIHFSGLGYCDRYREPMQTPLEPTDITYASGAAVLYRAEALTDVGLFDEALFLYHEDLDLGWRLRLAGWEATLAPASVVHHHYAHSRNTQKYYLMERNRWLVLGMHLTGRSLLTMAPLLVAAEAGIVATAWRAGWGKEKARAAGAFLERSTWKILLEGRKRSRARRRKTDREVTASFRGDVSFEGVTGPVMEKLVNPLMVRAWTIVRRALG